MWALVVSECSDQANLVFSPNTCVQRCSMHTLIYMLRVHGRGGVHVREEAGGDRCNSVKQQTANPLPLFP
jgi:hypothetical protein